MGLALVLNLQVEIDVALTARSAAEDGTEQKEETDLVLWLSTIAEEHPARYWIIQWIDMLQSQKCT